MTHSRSEWGWSVLSSRPVRVSVTAPVRGFIRHSPTLSAVRSSRWVVSASVPSRAAICAAVKTSSPSTSAMPSAAKAVATWVVPVAVLMSRIATSAGTSASAICLSRRRRANVVRAMWRGGKVMGFHYLLLGCGRCRIEDLTPCC
jgi:hypothetical protein